MLDINKEIIAFICKNWILILLLAVCIVRIVPPGWAGCWEFNNNKKEDGKAPRMTIIEFILTSFLNSIIKAFFIPLLATFGLKNTVTLVVLMVVVFDIFIRKQISGSAVTLVCVGIIGLYLDRLIETGEHIELFGKLLIWHKDKKTEATNASEHGKTQTK